VGVLIGLFIRLIVLAVLATFWAARILIAVIGYVTKVTFQLLAQSGATRSPDDRYWWNGRKWAPTLGRGYWAVPIGALASVVVLVGFSISAGLNSSSSNIQTASTASPDSGNQESLAVESPSLEPIASPAPSSVPTSNSSLKPSPVPKPAKAPQPPPPNLCGAPPNPWGYNFCNGPLIKSPPGSFCSYFNCIGSFWKSTSGYVDECRDGMYSHSGGRSGACSYHGGELRPLFA
jgi:hypothetical protein